MVLLVIPTPFLRMVMIANRSTLPVGVPLVCCSKGIENETLQCPYEILIEELPGKVRKGKEGPCLEKAETNPLSYATVSSMDCCIIRSEFC